MQLHPGYQVTPSVRLTRELGASRLGWLWAAQELTLGTEVAVQILPPDLASDLDVVERFIFEAQAGAKIESPHVVKILHIGVTADGLHYILSERVRGESLQSRVLHTGPIPLADVAIIVEQAASALAAAHKVGVLHRALSPAKIILSDPGLAVDVKVIDFDIANQHAHPIASRRGMTPAIAAAMSPEQLLTPDDIDARSDVWSLAVCAYHALTGAMPFAGDAYPELFMAVDRADFHAPSHFRRDLPAAVDAFFAKAFRHAIDERFGTVTELAQAFHAAAFGERGQVVAPLHRAHSGPTSGPLAAGYAAAPRPLSDAPIAIDYDEETHDESAERRRRARRAWGRWAIPAAAVVGAFGITAAILNPSIGERYGAAGGVQPALVAATDAAVGVPADPVDPPVVVPPAATAVAPPAAPAATAAADGETTAKPRTNARANPDWSRAPREDRVYKIDDTPKPKPRATTDNPYDDDKPLPPPPAAPEPKTPTPVDDPGF